MNNKFILLIGFYLVFIFSNLFSQIDEKELDELKQEIRLMIQKDMKIYKVVGISIALVDDQNVVWSEGFGYADQANNIPANSQTIYRVGSVSKLFTATSVMQLVENQKINLDEPIQTYIPEFKIKSRFEKQGEITARNLMTHHSGLPSDIENNFFLQKSNSIYRNCE
jgi:CubicO group peptidase (beta-lactamase class C family)